MLGADDILDDAHWVNVQDPIKQMFLSITKALRVQASSIRDLDRKCNDLATKDQLQHQINVLQDTVCSKQDATQIIYQLENKIGEKEFATLQAKHLQAVDTISRMQDQLEIQASTIQQLTLQISHLEIETEKLKNPNYDQLIQCMDRQIAHISSDFERKISLKIDKLEVESVIPQKLEDLYRNINGKYHELKLEIQRTVTKEEVLLLAQNKADRNEVRDLLATDRETRLSRADVTNLISAQNKGLFSTVSALEKNSSLLTQKVEYSVSKVEEKTRFFEVQLDTLKVDILSLIKEELFTTKSRAFTETVSQIVRDLVTQNPQSLGLLTKEKCETVMHEKVEFCLQQISIFQENIRLEMSTFLHQDLLQMQGKMNENVRKSEEKTMETFEEKLKKLKGILKEFSQNVAKSLSKKVDLRDFKAQQKDEKSRLVGSRELFVLQEDDKVGKSTSEFDELIKTMRSSYNNKEDDGSEKEYESHEESKQTSRRRRRRINKSDQQTHLEYQLQLKNSDSSKRQTKRPDPPHLTHQTPRDNNHTTSAVMQQAEEIQRLQQALHTLQHPHHHPEQRQLEVLDWRIALGELSTHLRTELSYKLSRDELFSIVSDNNSAFSSRLLHVEKEVVEMQRESEERKGVEERVRKVESEVKGLAQKVMGELIGARFLWTNGQSSQQSFLLWDTQVINAAPSSILWRQGTREVTIRVPGLYKVTVAVFAPVRNEDNNAGEGGGRGELSSNDKASIVQVYLNDEPILSYQPLSSSSSKQPQIATNLALTDSSQAYYLKRFRHSMGEVTSLLIDEFVSLPPESRLSVRYFANEPAQAFMAIRKM